jgi:hypothetical protein
MRIFLNGRQRRLGLGDDRRQKIHLVTLADKKSLAQGRVQIYKESVERFGYSLNILDNYDQRSGLLSKIYSFYKFIVSIDWPDDDLLVFTDSFDVIALKNPDHVLNIFNSYRSDIIFAAEREYCHQDQKNQKYFDRWYLLRPYRYLNAGLVMGPKKKLCLFYKYLSENIEMFPTFSHNGTVPNDQTALGSCFVTIKKLKCIPLKLTIDSRAKIILTLSSSLPLPGNIGAVFIHIPWLSNRHQLDKYNKVLDKYFSEGKRLAAGIGSTLGET